MGLEIVTQRASEGLITLGDTAFRIVSDFGGVTYGLNDATGIACLDVTFLQVVVLFESVFAFNFIVVTATHWFSPVCVAFSGILG